MGLVTQPRQRSAKLRNALRAAGLILSQAAAWASPLALVCSVDLPIVEPRQAATATVLTDASGLGGVRYEWKSSGGSFDHPNQRAAQWNANGAAEGPYTLSAAVSTADGSSGACSMVILVGRETRSAPESPTTRRLRSAMLLAGKKEAEKFGLYSYMLLASKPNASNRERYLTFLNAFTDTIVPYDRLNEQLPPAQLNIVYIPVRDEPPASFQVEEWLLDHYDYNRAIRLLESVPGAHAAYGPYIVSSNAPLDGSGREPARYLFQDLSTVPVSMIKFWVNQFRAQTAQERWDRATLGSVALRIRTGLEISAMAYPEISSSIKNLLSWK
jgi:hypothetical protein